MDKGVIKRLVNLYMRRSQLGGKEHGFESIDKDTSHIKKELESVEKEILLMLPKVKEYMDEPKRFIKILKELVNEDPDGFQVSFSQPPLDDFLSILIWEIKRARIIDEKISKKWVEILSKEGLEINY